VYETDVEGEGKREEGAKEYILLSGAGAAASIDRGHGRMKQAVDTEE
jgi:hypothetical protein